jgi:DNA-binding NarL/FixJ family response regulator
MLSFLFMKEAGIPMKSTITISDPICQLTERELEILQLLAEGRSNKHIANQLCITVRTVKFHTKNMYVKLAVCSRSEAIAWAWKNREVEGALRD